MVDMEQGLVVVRGGAEGVGSEVVTPLRDTVRLVDGDQAERAPRQQLGKTRDAQPFRSDEQEVEQARADDHDGQQRGPRALRTSQQGGNEHDRRRERDRPLHHVGGEIGLHVRRGDAGKGVHRFASRGAPNRRRCSRSMSAL